MIAAFRDGRLRKLRKLLALLRPYRGRVAVMMVALLVATAAALVPPYLAGLAIDDGIRGERLRCTRGDHGRVRGLRARLLGGHLRRDLPDQLGRPARPPGPAAQDLRPPAAAVDRLLLAQQDGRADLADHQRRAGARPARDRRHLHALLGHADPGRHRDDPAATRRAARPRHVPRVPAAVRGLGGVPDRLLGRLPPHAREDRPDHRVPPGVALRRARGAGVRPGGAPQGAALRAQRGQPRSQHAHGLPERRLLPVRGAAVGRCHRGDPPVRRQPGDRRRGDDRRARLVRLLPPELLRPDPAAVAAVHHLPGRHGGARQDLRAARRGARPERCPGRGRAAAGARRDPLRGRVLHLRRGPGAVRRRPDGAARPDRGAGWRDRRG